MVTEKKPPTRGGSRSSSGFLHCPLFSRKGLLAEGEDVEELVKYNSHCEVIKELQPKKHSSRDRGRMSTSSFDLYCFYFSYESDMYDLINYEYGVRKVRLLQYFAASSVSAAARKTVYVHHL